jgi:hypothetical protein
MVVSKLICSDMDEDCNDIADKNKCQDYDPCQGLCPFIHLWLFFPLKNPPKYFRDDVV